jgi:XTP/dITP diphosphohydrolase
MKLCFASHNQGKINELAALIGEHVELIGLSDLKMEEDIPETGSTFKENALLKANFVWERFQIPCFADDSGLEVEALNGAPGVYSARYAGPEANSQRNMDKLLGALSGIENRKARFVTTIALVGLGRDPLFFEGEIKGHIIFEKRGKMGFGYDPLFVPDGYDISFAEMAAEEKNRISHRAKAVSKLLEYLKNSE